MDVETSSDRPNLEDEGRVGAGGCGVPMQWDRNSSHLPDGYDGALARSVEGHEADAAPNTLCLMAVAVVNNETQRGLAGMALSALRARATDAGLGHVVAPVRPSLKSRYPLTDMEIFALGLVEIDREVDRGTYVEDNLWMQHV